MQQVKLKQNEKWVKYGTKFYLVRINEVVGKLRAYEVYEDGSGVSTGFQEDYLYNFNELVRKGDIQVLEKLPKLPRTNNLKITLDLNNYDKGELELLKKQYKASSLEEVFKVLIRQGIYRERDNRD